MEFLPSQEYRTLISWPKAIVQALESAGIASQPLLDRAGIPPHLFADPNAYIDSRNCTKLILLAVEASGDPGFGLKAAGYMHPASFHALGYALYASKTLYDFWQRIKRFSHLLADTVEISIGEGTDFFSVTLDFSYRDVCDEEVDAWLACMLTLCRNIYRPNFMPQRVELTRPASNSQLDIFHMNFGSRIKFSAPDNVVYFDRGDMLATLPAANAELARRNDQLVMAHLLKLKKSDLVRRVEVLVIEQLPSGDCNKNTVASALNMSSSNLQKKLEQKNTNFKDILERLRTELARNYVEQLDMPITEITYLLGFSTVGNFSRAFRRWTGLSPSEYRESPPANNTL
jgi:AraC-like DNA-binding protein